MGEHKIYLAERVDPNYSSGLSDATNPKLNLVDLSDSLNHKSNISWGPLIATEATGATLGGVVGAGTGYFGSKVIGHSTEFLLSAFSKGGRVFSPTAVEEFAVAGAKSGGMYGVAFGLAAAGIGYGAYEGLKWLTDDQQTMKNGF